MLRGTTLIFRPASRTAPRDPITRVRRDTPRAPARKRQTRLPPGAFHHPLPLCKAALTELFSSSPILNGFIIAQTPGLSIFFCPFDGGSSIHASFSGAREEPV